MNTVAIVQARMGSSRLPGKVMKPVAGEPMIYHTLTRLRNARYVNQIVLATSDRPDDSLLADFAESIDVAVFRGSESDVLHRFIAVAEQWQADRIVRITGDCPLIDPIIVDHLCTYHELFRFDYARLDVPQSFVRGFDVEVVTTETLMRVESFVTALPANEQQQFREHVTNYIYTHRDHFSVGVVKSPIPTNTQINLSVDRPEDFERIVPLIQHESYLSICKELNLLENGNHS